MAIGFLFSTFIICILVIRTIIQYIGIRESFRFIDKERKKKYSRIEERKLVIFIPVFNETKIIKESIRYFSEVSKEFSIPIYYITTEKEGSPNNNNTYKLIQKYKRKNIDVIHTPNINAQKAEQLNYAFGMIFKNKKEVPTYFGIFDCDSKPEKEMFNYSLSDKENPSFYQALPMYSTNFESLNNISKANAIFQTRWLFSYELPRLIKNYQANKIKKLNYFIGHGLFINSKYVFSKNKKVFTQKSIAEDLDLGYKNSFEGIVIKPIPYFDYCLVPNETITNIKQTSRWFYGELGLINIFFKRKDKFKFNQSKLLIERMFILLNWLLATPLFVLSLIIILDNQNFILLLLYCISIVSYILFLHKKMNSFFKIKKKTYFFLLIKGILNSFGPIIGTYKKLVNILFKKDEKFNKTQR